MPKEVVKKGGNKVINGNEDRKSRLKDLIHQKSEEIYRLEGIHIYDEGKVVDKLFVLPDYVQNASIERLSKPIKDPRYDKIFLDKWGRRCAETKKYVETPEMISYRVALLAAEGLVDKDKSLNYEKQVENCFYKFFNRELFFNTPYMANGGHILISKDIRKRLKDDADPSLLNDLEQEEKVRGQLFACFVLGLYDSRSSIFKGLSDAAEIHALIGGTGFNFSHLRPANESIHSTGGITDGPISFMAMFSNVLGKVINQGGKREGANMFMLDSNHPDIMRFIYSKRQDGEVSSANMSAAIDHDFMDALDSNRDDSFYPLKNPHYNPKLRPHIPKFYSEEQLKQSQEVVKGNAKAKISLLFDENGIDILSPWIHEGMDNDDRIIGKIKEGIVYLDAKKVMRHLAYSSWFNGEPSVIFTGNINDHNPTHPRYYEQYLLEQGEEESRNLVEKLKKGKDGPIEKIIKDYVWATDEEGRLVNVPLGVGVIESTNPCGEKPLLPNEACALAHINLEKILIEDDTMESGYRVDYDKFRDDTRLLASMVDNSIDQNEFINKEIERKQKSNRKIGLGFMGLANMLYKLEVPYNSEEGRKFVDKILGFWERESDEISYERGEKLGVFPNFKYSCHRKGRNKRNAIVRTIAPTGTTSFAAETTGGMEPEYALAYTRETAQGTKINIVNSVFEEKLKKYPIFNSSGENEKIYSFIRSEGDGSIQTFEISRGDKEDETSFNRRLGNLEKLKNIFVTTYDISPEDHIRMQAIVQSHVDDSISKTTNFRKNATPEDIEKIFRFAYKLGIKGLTFYRDGTRKGQPLNVKVDGYIDEESLKGRRKKRRKLREMVMSELNRARPQFVYGPREKIPTPFGNAFVAVGFEEDGEGNRIDLYESFVDKGKGGKDISAITEGYGRLMSALLKSGVSLEYIAEQLGGIGGETQMGVGEKKVLSLPDAISRGINRILDKEAQRNGQGEKKSSKKEEMSDNFCPTCNIPLVVIETCLKCTSCGYSKC